MSSTISGKVSDSKESVSFDSDSDDDDDDTSSSSRLSSSASSEVESDVETVTFSVPLLPQSKVKEPNESAGRNESAVYELKNREQEHDLNKNTTKDDASKSRSSPNKADLVETSLTRFTTSNMDDDAGDELKPTRTSSTKPERATSPKITINDVEATENDVTGTSKSVKKTRSNSPKKTTNDETSEESIKSAASSIDLDTVKSPKSSDSEVVTESEKTLKKSSKFISAFDSDEISTESSKSAKSGEEPERPKSKSSKFTSEERETERSSSPKKIPEGREKSPRNSPRETSGEARKKSSEAATKALDDLIRCTESQEKSPTRNTKGTSEINQETEDTEEVTKKTKKTNKSKNLTQEEDDKLPKIAADKTDGENVSKNFTVGMNNKELSTTKDPASFQDNGLAEDLEKDHTSGFSKYASRKFDIDDDLDILGDIRKTKRSELDKADESDIGKKDGSTSGQRTSRNTEHESDGIENASISKSFDYLKTGDETESSKDLVNEDSEFTYRRKSMDDFIKRILAEAKEEKLKQKQGQTNETKAAEEQDKQTDRHLEQNGNIQKEILGKPPKWIGIPDKEASSLDKRLANIEKRKPGGNEPGKVQSSKVKEGEEEETAKKKPLQNDIKDFETNLDDDLEEINRFLQSRKSAAAQFDFDDEELANDSTVSTTTGKRRWLTDSEPAEQPEAVDAADDGVRTPGSKSQPRKRYGDDLDFDNDDDRYLARFKRERDPLLPETLFSPRRRDETNEIVRERTRNVRVLVDQQVNIVQSMRNTSKNLDELEREIREVRQVCLNRQARIESLEDALGAEFREFENDQLAASDRQRSGDVSLDDDFGRLRRKGKPSFESLDEDSFPFRRRSGSVASLGSYSQARSSDLGTDLSDLRPPSGRRQQRGSDFRTADRESDSQELDRLRARSVNRDRMADINPFGPDDPGLQLNQRSARSRASIATSSPALDFPGSDSADSFLSKIRAKYSFLAPSVVDSFGYSGSTRGQSSSSSSNYRTSPLLSSSDFKYGGRPRSSLEDSASRTKDLVASSMSPSSYSSVVATGGSYRPSYNSSRDSRSPGYGAGGFIGGSSDRLRRAQSVTEFSIDRPTGSPTHLGSTGSWMVGGGGEFHSRFLDKVRGKKAMGDEAPATKDHQEKPFKSRFLKTTSFDSSSSRSNRVPSNGLEDEFDGNPEANGDA